MNLIESQDALAWAVKVLKYEGPTKLTKDDVRLWLLFAQEFTKEDFTDGITQYALHRTKEWPPAFGEIRKHMPSAKKEDKRGKAYPKDWVEEGGKYSGKNYENYLNARAEELKK